jgi:hypothetical protein
MDKDGFIRTLSRFGQIYDSGRENGFIYWFTEWFIVDVWTTSGKTFS